MSVPWSVAPAAGSPFEGELDGPVWDGRALLFCNATRNELWRYDDDAGAATPDRRQTVRTRGLAFAPDGRLYAAQTRARRIVWYRDDGASYYVESMVDGERRNDPLHLVIDNAGRIWSTDRWTEDSSGGPVGYPPLAYRAVLRLDPGATGAPDAVRTFTVHRATGDTTQPHGVALAPDERTLYVSDDGADATPPTLRSYRISPDGGLSDATILRRYAAGDGAAGLAVAADGTIVAVAGAPGSANGSRVETVRPDGSAGATLALASGAPTACAFGGRGLDVLFVTTATGELIRITNTGLRGRAMGRTT